MLCSCPGPDELTYLTQGLCARPRLVLLVLLVPAAGKLTPSNVGKLTPCRSTLCVLANAHPLGLTLGSDWEGKSRGAGDSPKCALSSLPEPRSPKPQDPTRTPLPPPNPQPQCSEQQSLKAPWVPAFCLLPGFGALAWKPEVGLQISPGGGKRGAVAVALRAVVGASGRAGVKRSG